MEFRIAIESDLEELAQMRWDFRVEESLGTPVHDQQSFLEACTAFLRQGLSSRLDDGFGYVTNVYTRPAYRGRGIGAELMAHVVEWAQAQDLERLFVGPSDASVRFYERAGFRWNEDLMEYVVRPYVP